MTTQSGLLDRSSRLTLPRPRLHRRHLPAAFALAMSLLVSATVTGLLTGVNTGFGAGYALRWLQALSMAWPTAFVLVFLVGPRLRRLVETLARS